MNVLQWRAHLLDLKMTESLQKITALITKQTFTKIVARTNKQSQKLLCIQTNIHKKLSSVQTNIHKKFLRIQKNIHKNCCAYTQIYLWEGNNRLSR